MKSVETGWARLSSRVHTDPDWLACSAPARLVFLTSIALAKASGRDGLVSLRAMQGVQFGALSAEETEEAAVELVARRLWEITDSTNDYMVRSFLKWNESNGDQLARREARRLAAIKSHHGRGLHKEPDPECSLCAESGQGAVARAEAHGPARALAHGQPLADPRANACADKTRQDETRQDQTPPALGTPDSSDDNDVVVVVADSLIEALGHFGDTARPDELRYTQRALERGWTHTHLTDLAVEAASKVDVESPRAWLKGGLKRMANTEPESNDKRPAGKKSEPTRDYALNDATPATNYDDPAVQHALNAELEARYQT